MRKSTVVMIVFACIFAVLTLLSLFFEGLFAFGSMDALFFSANTLGDALGGIFLLLFAIIVGVVVLFFALCSLPFIIVLLKQVGKKWYSLTFLIFTIVAIVLAITFVLVPIISGNASNGASSSSSLESATALLY